MLSTIGRAAVKRVVAGGPLSTNRASQSIWQIQRIALSQRADDTSSRSHVLFLCRRSYATTTKAAPKPKSKSSTTAKPRAKKAAAKKAVKKPAKKPTKRGRPALKKKPVKRLVKKTKKVLTEAQKERAEITKLKAKALTTPKLKPKTAWLVFVTEQAQKVNVNASTAMKEWAARYKAMSPTELESLNHTANQNRAANDVLYKQWVEAHTPDQIRLANNARQLLKKKFKKTSFPPILDSRLPKRPVSARFFFVKDRYASGDFKGISLPKASKLIQTEWNSLPAGERKAYEDRAAGDHTRYVQEIKTVYHRDLAAQKQT